MGTSSESKREVRQPTQTVKRQLQDSSNSGEILHAFEGTDPQIRELAERQLAAALTLTKPNSSDPGGLAAPAVRSINKQKAEASQTIQQVSHAEVELPLDPIDEPEEPNESKPSTKSVAPLTTETKPVERQLSVDELTEQLLDRLGDAGEGDNDRQMRRAITQAMLMAVNGRTKEGVAALAELSITEQERQFFEGQLESLSLIADDSGPPSLSKRYAQALPRLKEAISHLGAATGSLKVSKPLFCSEVESYGSVSRFKHDRFTAGQQVILYCEVDHFVAEKVSKGYETQLQGAYELFNQHGVKVSEQVLPEDKQTCDHYRRDYFIAYRMYLPSHLEPGSYRLRLTMEDHKGKLYGQSETEFEIIKGSR
jgi:hypothetical protein